MKLSQFKNAFIMSLAVISMAQTNAADLISDEQAIAEGMTPVEEVNSANGLEVFNMNRSEYVTTIPSLDDIQRVIESNRQVIVVNKAAKGPDAQTLRVYQNGVIRPIIENTVISKVVNGKTVKEVVPVSKEFVKISTGTEAKKVSPTRTYVATTPKGFFRPQRVFTDYFSATWQASMPNPVFINCRKTFKEDCGIAIHATSESHYAELGTRASGGCVRTRLEVSKQIRELVMDSGLGSQPGNYKLVPAGHGRKQVIGNTVQVDLVDRMSGAMLGTKVNSWDTVIVIYE